MNGSGKQSFYEIQLNNASLIVAFLVAVGLGVAVFMLGVMVGRGQTGAAAEEGGWVEEFGETESAEPEATEPEFFEKVEEEDDAGSESVEEPAVAGTAEEDGGEGEVAPPEPEITAPDDLPPNDPALASGYVIQVKATGDRTEADELQAELAAAGFPAFVVTGDVNGRTMHRVRVGRYASESDALEVEAALGRHPSVEQTWVTQG